MSRLCQSLERIKFDKAGLQPDQIKFQEQFRGFQQDLSLTYSSKVIRKGPIGWRKWHHQRRLTPGSAQTLRVDQNISKHGDAATYT